MKIGDLVKLPSGKKVRIMCPAVPERPWAALQVGWTWQVCREHGHEAPGVAHYFHENRPIQLDEVDARALAEALNRAG